MRQARVADALTGSRGLLVPVMAVLIARRQIDAAAVLLGVAWTTDFLDGRLARRASAPTRLSGWDLRIDSWLAIGLGVGVAAGGYVSWWVVAPLAAAVAGASVFLRNPAPVMVGIGGLTALFLGVVLTDAAWWWLPAAYCLILLVVDWRRFWRVIMPALWHGFTSILRGERHTDRRLVIDEWSGGRTQAPSASMTS